MTNGVTEYIEGFPESIKELFLTLRALVTECAPNVEEKRWAGMPSYYHDGKFVRLIPFKDHINIEASGVAAHTGELGGFSLTPKGMLQLRPGGQDIPEEILKSIFSDTFLAREE